MTIVNDLSSILWLAASDFEILSDHQEWRAEQAARGPFCRTVFRSHATRVTCTSRAGTCQGSCLRTAYVAHFLRIYSSSTLSRTCYMKC
jgi:hypothetical protein